MSDFHSPWPLLPIGAIAAGRLGGNYKNGPEPSGRPLIKMGNIARINIDLSKLDYIPDSEHVSEEHRLRYGDVLFNTRNTLDLVGKVSIWRDELPFAYYNSNISRLEFYPQHCGDSQYFGYTLNTKSAIKDIRALATGTTSVAAVYARDLLKLEVPVPPRDEQLRITAALTEIDNLITALGSLIAKKQAIKQGMMQQLLTGKTRLPRFDKRWPTVKMADVATVSRGASPRPIASPRWFDETSPVGWVRITDVSRSDGLTLKSTTQRLSAEGIARSRFLPAGTLIMSIAATVGLPIITGIDTCIHDGFVAFESLHGVDQVFLLYMLKHFEREMQSAGQTGSQANLNTSIVGRLSFPMPSEAEQRCIGTVLRDVDVELSALRRRLVKSRAIKTCMMQQLLTGRIRLPIEKAGS
jgi:type I restriction enzyme, S subunit